MKKYVIIFALLNLAVSAIGQNDNLQRAREAALRASHSTALRQITTDADMKNVFLFTADDGKLIVATSDALHPILGYSDEPVSDPQQLPSAMMAWLQAMDSEISSGLLGSHSTALRKDLPDTVAPLITSKWNQYGNGYNSQTPALEGLDNSYDGHCDVGCSALAMGQVMRYWHWPQHGIGRRQYTYAYMPQWLYDSLDVDFRQATYNYDSMPDQLNGSSTDTERFEVAQLLYHCGVATYSFYNANGQGATGSLAEYQLSGLTKCFGYNCDAYLAYRDSCTADTWLDLIKGEVAEGRPVLYSAEIGAGGGHAFIIDGYDTNNHVHVNWGWAGGCDGYYDITTLQPVSAYQFTVNQRAIIGLDTNQGTSPMLHLVGDPQITTDTVHSDRTFIAEYTITNTGTETYDGYIGACIYNYPPTQFQRYVDARHVSLATGDTLHVAINQHVTLDTGSFILQMEYSPDAFTTADTNRTSSWLDDGIYCSEILFYVSEPDAGIESADSEKPVIFPNPASDFITVSGLPEDCTVSLFDMQGRVVRQTSANHTTDISLRGLSAGIYMLNVRSAEAATSQKVIIR